MIDDGDVSVNGNAAKPSYKISEMDEIEVEITEIATENFDMRYSERTVNPS
jgi:ribosomal 50S subunit-recycling heat shock protein